MLSPHIVAESVIITELFKGRCMCINIMRLSLYELRKNITKNPLLCFLFIIGSVLSCLIFIYYYGNSFSQKLGGHALNEAYRGFELQLKRKEDISASDLTVLDNFKIEEVEVSTGLDLPPEYRENLPDQVLPRICAYRDNFENVSSGSPIFEENSLSDNLIIVPKELSNLTSIRFNGIEFSVAGYSSSPEVFVVPIDAYTDNFQADTISYLCFDPLSDKEVKEAESILKNRFPAAAVLSPNNAKDMDKKEDSVAFIKVSMLYVTSLFSFLFLFRCMIDQSQHELTIYALLGAKKITIMKLLLWEVIVLSVSAFLIALAIHMIFYQSFFSQINIMDNIEYSVGDYAFVLLTTLLLSVCAAVPFAYTCCRSTVAQMKRNYNT